MSTGLKTNDRNRALRALDEAKAFVQGTIENVDGDALEVIQKAGDRIQQANSAFVLALLRDDWCPAKLFAPWASVRRIQDWGTAGKVTVEVKHGRSCVKPSDFFRHFNSLKE
jgi:hypothetical protein